MQAGYTNYEKETKMAKAVKQSEKTPKSSNGKKKKAPIEATALAPVSKLKSGAKPAPAKDVTAKAKTAKTRIAEPAPSAAKSVATIAKEASDDIAKLASDVLADRIIPTIEHIKALATAALGKDKSKAKGKKKAAKTKK